MISVSSTGHLALIRAEWLGGLVALGTEHLPAVRTVAQMAYAFALAHLLEF